MNVTTRPAVAALLLLFSIFFTTTAQQKHQAPVKTQPKVSARPTPAPTFDTLIPADTYALYGEVRGVGQLIRSDAATDLLEPILKLAGPPKEFKTIVRWLNAHADQVMTSRLLVATWATGKDLPDAIIAIEFASSEEAAKFATPLNEILPTIVPPVPEVSPDQTNSSATGEKSKPETVEKPRYYLQQAGSLIVLTATPLTLKKLKAPGGKLLTEEQNFRVARNRFNSEPVFVFVDLKAIEKQEEEQRKRYEVQIKEEAERIKREQAAQEESKTAEAAENVELVPEEDKAVGRIAVATLGAPEVAKEAPTPDPISSTLSLLTSSLGRIESKWPDGVAVALSFESDSFDLRALLLSPAGEKSDPVPFLPMLVAGPPFVPEAPNILPADTQLFATMSLDLPQIYSIMSRPAPKPESDSSRGNVRTVSEVEFESPFAAIEKQLKIKIKDDLLPLLGSEVAFRTNVGNFGVFGLPKPPAPKPDPKENATKEQPPASEATVLAISLKDREAMRALMPKLIESMGFKGASALAQTERREDTELVSYLNAFSYAFVGNFLVLSSDPAAVRHVVDSYLKNETLAADSQFRAYTRWQPRPLHGQVYISPALMESYTTWAEQPSTRVSEQTRAFLTRLTATAQPITYSVSNEGFGPLHELHLPKNLVLMAVVGISGEANPPTDIRNERLTIGLMYTIAYAEEQFKTDKGAGSYGTLEQLIAAQLVSKEMVDTSGYKIDMTVSGDKYEVSAVPLEYKKTGSTSYFIDNTRVLRGGDRNGASATGSDPPIH